VIESGGSTGLDGPTRELVRVAAAATADPEGAMTRLSRIVTADPGIAADEDRLRRVAAVAGASRALAESIAAHPELLGNDPGRYESVPLRLRALLTAVAGDELTGAVDLTEATARLSDGFDAMVEDALARARSSVADRHPAAADVPIAVIAMGKWGGREINYYSDLDLVFVHGAEEGRETDARVAAIAVAGRLMTDLSTRTYDGTGIAVDVDLRPEGSTGPLSRSLESYRAYYARWGEAWELQALLKARPAAGDAELGRLFRQMADVVVWDPGLDAEALRSIRLLKTRAEQEAPARDIKRSPGGIRDIEFSVQMLQLVHGRFDTDLRVRGTLEAIAALGEHGYIEGREAEALSDNYRFLRNLEHRLQIWDLVQTHLLPDGPEERERLGRSLGLGGDSAAALEARLAKVRREVRDLHERLYFRPILDSLAGMDQAFLDADEASLRLAALGFRDVPAAVRAFEDMTSGLSRRSRVMQQVLPLMLDWLSQSPDPDLGLAQMRLLLANTTDHGALVSLLQGNPAAGERLCTLLGTGRLLGQLMDRMPEFIPSLAGEQPVWEIRDAAGATERLVGLLDSRPEMDAKIGTIRRFVRRRKLRIAARDVLAGAPVEETLASLSDGADAALAGALHALGAEDGSGFAVVAMGKWGGRELSYGSDVDVIYVFGADADREAATRIAVDFESVVSTPGRHGDGYLLDSELRPEGRRGPIARSIEGYARYYREWAEPWELLALVKARPAVGDRHVLASFAGLISEVLWARDLDPSVAREVRAIKARVEAERVPLGEDPAYHIKLGPGGLSDVEFLTQLLQLRHGGAVPEARVTGTIPALDALLVAGVLGDDDHAALREAYLFLTRVRLRLHLQRGQDSDMFPTSQDHLARLAASLGFDRHSDLLELYRRHTRRARRVFEDLFFQ
jgi:glutamate-ammonia-ligase adenylyltransferase